MIDIIDRLKLPFRKDKELFSSLHDIMGFYPHDISLYKQALSHSSLDLHEQNGRRINNERLEFLGDAIIEAVTSDIVYRHFSRKREGFLTATRSKLVQRDTLNKLSKEIGIDALLRKAQSNAPNQHSNIGGNALEAVVGAIYLDRGYDYCLDFLRKNLYVKRINIDNIAKKEVNFKSRLLEWAQRNRLRIEFIANEPPKDAATSATPAFEATVSLEGVVCGKGNGFSKKESQQNAARETLLMLNKDKSIITNILKAKEERTAMEAELVSVPPRITASGETKRPRQKRKPAKRQQTADKAADNTAANNATTTAAQDTTAAPSNARQQSAPKRNSDNKPRRNAANKPASQQQPKPQPAATADKEAEQDSARDAIIAEAESKAFEA